MTPRGRAAASGLAVVILLALPLLPEILGARRLIFRDAQVTHWPWRRVAADTLASGDVPFIDAHASGGEPLLANPNAVLLYPTVLLESILPPASAFNLHYLLHVVWAFLGGRVLARRLGLAEGPAFLSGVAFAFSGMMLSYASAFMNSSAAAAWLPWCAAAALGLARADDRREILRAGAAAGIAFGLQLLAGEPALSLLTIVFAAILAFAESWSVEPRAAGPRMARLAAGGLLTGVLALALAAPLLLPLRQVFPLTYRGQHLYSEEAFGAAAFDSWRMPEWLLPRFGGNPGGLGEATNWLRGGQPTIVYIWCVTFGVVPLLLILTAGLRRDFWNRRSAGLAGGAILALLFSFGLGLPFYRLLYGVPSLRRLRYPIKFYLLTALCVALLAGLSAQSLGRRRAGRREAITLAAFFTLFAAVWLAAGGGGLVDLSALPATGDLASRESFLALVRSDALLGLAAVAIVGALLWSRSKRSDDGYAFGFSTVLLAFAWGLPLFVSAPTRDLGRPPALLRELRGAGRVYVSPELPQFDRRALEENAAGGGRLSAKVARVLIEELQPATGSAFGIRYLFETDPDGSYGYYNRIASEAAAASSPAERDRLLRLFGARWVLAPASEAHPLFRTVTGFAVAGKRLLLFEHPDPLPELRWASRAYRRRSLSGTIELLRSPVFDPARDVALPGREDRDASGPAVEARVIAAVVGADRARASIEAAGGGFLLFSRTFFPTWKARLDGASAPVLVANARDLAVAVPGGRHTVELEFDRAPFRRGVVFQTLAVAAVLLTAAARSRLWPRSGKARAL